MEDFQENAVEMPIAENKTLSFKPLAIVLFAGLALLILSAVIFKDNYRLSTKIIQTYLPWFLMSCLFIGLPLTFVINPFVYRKHLIKVCTKAVVGEFAGYAQQTFRKKNGIRTSVYAPKYKVFVNNRYEIRTVDDFGEKNPRYECQTSLLVNPSTSEIIRADKKFSSDKKFEIIGLIFFILLFIGIAVIVSIMD